MAKNLFVSESIYTGDTPYHVWSDLDNSSLDFSKLTYFQNSIIAIYSK